jgi:hypothetical protein
MNKVMRIIKEKLEIVTQDMEITKRLITDW